MNNELTDSEIHDALGAVDTFAYEGVRRVIAADRALREQAQPERKPVMPDFQMSENECGHCSGTVHNHSPDCLLHQDNIGEKP